jgi:hypothetical protein
MPPSPPPHYAPHQRPLGILQLNTAGLHRPPGDVANPASWPFPIKVAVIGPATQEAIIGGVWSEDLVTAFVRAGRRLIEEEGCVRPPAGRDRRHAATDGCLRPSVSRSVSSRVVDSSRPYTCSLRATCPRSGRVRFSSCRRSPPSTLSQARSASLPSVRSHSRSSTFAACVVLLCRCCLPGASFLLILAICLCCEPSLGPSSKAFQTRYQGKFRSNWTSLPDFSCLSSTLSQVGANPNTPVVGVPENGIFQQVLYGQRAYDAEGMLAEVLEAGDRLRAACRQKGGELMAIVLECTNMCVPQPFSHIRKPPRTRYPPHLYLLVSSEQVALCPRSRSAPQRPRL